MQGAWLSPQISAIIAAMRMSRNWGTIVSAMAVARLGEHGRPCYIKPGHSADEQ